MKRSLLRAACCCALSAVPVAAYAHGIAGARVFPATLTMDDPAVGDEFSLPTLQVTPGQTGTASNEYQYAFEWDKTIVKGFGVAVNDGWENIRQPAGIGGNLYGWQDPVVTLKYEFLENDPHEILASVGVQREFGGGGAPVHLPDVDFVGWTQPTLYLGKGLGDLPNSVGLLRPFAVTGELGYQWSDKINPTISGAPYGNPDFWNIAFSVQYSMEYLQSQVKDYGLPEFINNMIPLVEVTYATPASASHAGNTTAGQIAPGILYEGGTYQIGLEALIPATHAAGNELGVIAQLHFYLDDIFPTTLGKPLFDGEAPRL
jgi:hypothetical protein